MIEYTADGQFHKIQRMLQMDNEKTNEALTAAEQAIKAYGERCGRGLEWETSWSPARNPEAVTTLEQIRHVRWCITEASSWPAERLEKKFRWLGFVQGALWMMGIQSIEESKKHNMPPGETFNPDQHVKARTSDDDMREHCAELGYKPGSFEE